LCQQERSFAAACINRCSAVIDFMILLQMSMRPFLQPLDECLSRCILAAFGFDFRRQLFGHHLADVGVNVFTIRSFRNGWPLCSVTRLSASRSIGV